MTLDVEKLTVGSPLLHGPGTVFLTEAAEILGIPIQSLLNELRTEHAPILTSAQDWRGWMIENIGSVERDYDNTFVRNDVETRGERKVLSQLARALQSAKTIAALITYGTARESIFLLSGTGAFFADDEIEIPLAAWMVQKVIAERLRIRLASRCPPVDIATRGSSLLAAPPISEPLTLAAPKAIDALRFSDLARLQRDHCAWGEDNTRRMKTEANLFIELLDDPLLSSVTTEMIQEYANSLSRLPSDIYQSQRRYKVKTLNALIEIAANLKLPCKEQPTIKNHVGKISEILNFGVTNGKLSFNPAAGYKRPTGAKKKMKKRRAQDYRDRFPEGELERIFSQPWFSKGTGDFSSTGNTNWRPHHFWLPLFALLGGGRLNELAQLYLDDIRQADDDEGVWYFDFNLANDDKIEADDSNSIGSDDKSLKTINSIRIVPIHRVILEAGLPEYVASLRKSGETRLFPELRRDRVKGYGKPAGSWFNERFLGNSLKIKRDGKKTFHSFRHNFATVVERLDISERVTAQLLGHERGDTESATRYAKDRNASALNSIIDRIQFPCLSNIGRFDVDAGMRALDIARRRKAAMVRRESA